MSEANDNGNMSRSALLGLFERKPTIIAVEIEGIGQMFVKTLTAEEAARADGLLFDDRGRQNMCNVARRMALYIVLAVVDANGLQLFREEDVDTFLQGDDDTLATMFNAIERAHEAAKKNSLPRVTVLEHSPDG